MSLEEFRESRSLGPLMAFARNSQLVLDAPETLHTLQELELDLEHFKVRRKFRREVDLTYLLKEAWADKHPRGSL
jgi:hypothetical protein